MGECFESLAELSVLSGRSKETLKSMAKFRNLLVHGYWKVNDERVYDYGKNNLSDFEDYLKDIEKFIFSLPEG
ncbi:MAG: DUF86 domain-containing protein [Bacteroidetes bacterium]|nr:DUF86 domain-containing protein [Bacteroidota bacterium]